MEIENIIKSFSARYISIDTSCINKEDSLVANKATINLSKSLTRLAQKSLIRIIFHDKNIHSFLNQSSN